MCCVAPRAVLAAGFCNTFGRQTDTRPMHAGSVAVKAAEARSSPRQELEISQHPFRSAKLEQGHHFFGGPLGYGHMHSERGRT